MEPVAQHTGRHHQWTSAGTTPGLVDTRDRAESAPGEGRFQRQSAIASGDPHPVG